MRDFLARGGGGKGVRRIWTWPAKIDAAWNWLDRSDITHLCSKTANTLGAGSPDVLGRRYLSLFVDF